MQNISKTNIREIFTSIQGEGLYVGEKQIFVRFSKCNLKCDFCDTDFEIKKSKEYDVDRLFEELNKIDCDVVSLTGGEPLVDVVFLKEFLEKYKTKLNKKIYLETNGTLYSSLEKIIDYVDVVAMDIKLHSSTKQKNSFIDNEKFLKVASKKEKFIKIVFDNNIQDEEINEVVEIAKKYNTTIVLQPKMPLDYEIDFNMVFDKFYSKYKNVRLICQTHKFLNLQ